MGPNSGGGKRNKVDASKVSSARGRFSNSAFPGKNKAKKKGGGGRGGGAKASDSAGRGKPEGSATGGGGGRGGGRPTDATVIQKLAARVSSGATSGVGAGRGGSGGGGGVGGDGRDPLKGVDVAGLEEISIAEGDWQSVFRLLKDIGLFDAAGPDGGSGARGGDGNTSNLGPPPSGTDTLTGKSAPAPAAGAGAGAAGRGGCPPNPSARTGLTANGGAAPPATVTTATSPAFCSPPTPPTPTPGAGQGQQHDPAIMAYLTKLLAFPEADAARALSNTSGNDLAAALDYLCLHTDDAGLKRGFRRGGSGGRGGGGGKGGGPAGIGGSSKIGGGAGGGRNVSAAARVGRKALAATPIEVVSSAGWQVEHRVLSLVKLGFKREEAEAALSSSSSGEVMGHDTLTRLLEPLRPARRSPPDPGGGKGSAELSSSIRSEEELVLSSIFGEEAFRVAGSGAALRWEVNATLGFEGGGGGGISADTTVTILFQKGKRYPFDAPLVLVTNESLPPGLARKLIEAANTRAAAMAGPDPIVHGLVGWLQGGSKACHATFLKEAREREARMAAEKKERAALARAGKKGGPKGSRGVSQQLQRQQQPKAATATASTGAATASSLPPPPPSAVLPSKANSDGKDAAAVHKLHLALTAGGGGGGVSSGVGGVIGGAAGEGMALANLDGYRPTPYLQEVIQVLEDTKASQPWLEAQEAKSLPLPPLAHAAEQAMKTQQQRQSGRRGGGGAGKDDRAGGRFNGEAAEAERLRAREQVLSDSLLREFEKKQQTRPYQDMLAKRSKLPAYEMREHIVHTVKNAQVVVVSGETGCGKTTQVPQLVLDTMIMEREGASANIIVTQPRRISAVGVAERIAAERAERIGETAGYQIRLESKRSKATRLLLCTTGILLRRLQVDPWLASVSHVFVDEVHERDLDTDFLLIILKGLLAKRPGLKLVLMSATLNADMFSDFFGGAPVVKIPGRAHPVTPFFLEDVLERTGYMVDPKGDFAVKGSKGGGGGGGRGGGGGGGGGGCGMKPGDWECPSCGNNCFASKGACNRCGARKPDGAGGGGFSMGGGGGGRGGGQGGKRPGDWDCPGCGNNCFASKSVCQRCNTAKPKPGDPKPKGNNVSQNGHPGGTAGAGSGAGGAPGGAAERPTIGQIKKRYGGYSDHVHQSLLVVDENIINYEAISSLLEYITFNFEDGAILVFLPGLAEITKMLEALADNPLFNDKEKTRVYPLHGSLSTTEQKAIFEVPPKGVRKIVVSTNIAETSITIEDCVFVVDSCRVKENRFDDANMMPMLLECWVSKASAKQRRGRAGRVRPGVCFHMCASGTFQDTISEFQLPEMLRVSLDDMVLQILLLDKGDPAEFLASAVNPPTELAVENSIKYLCQLQATQLDEDNKPMLTALGFHLATLPVEPRVGKMMLYGAIFGCVEPAITIAAAMSCRNPFVAPFDKRDVADEARRNFALALSDHLTLLKAYDGWRLARGCGSRAEREYIRDHFLSRQTLVMVEEMRRQFRGLLRDIGFIEGGGGGGEGFSRGNGRGGDQHHRQQQQQSQTHSSNVNGGNIQLIKAVVCAGLYPNVTVAPASLCPTSTSASAAAAAAATAGAGAKKGGGASKGGGARGGAAAEKTAGEVSLQGKKGAMFLHPMTVNFDKKELDSRYGVYHEVVKTSKVYIRDMTTVTPLMLALFGGSLQVHHERQAITVDNWLHFRAARRAATLVKYLRVHMERLLLRKITHPQEDVSDNGRDLIQSVSTLLRSGARRAGVQQDYSAEMLAAEINGVRQGAHGFDGGARGGEQAGQQQQQQQQQYRDVRQGGGQGRQDQPADAEEAQKHLRIMQRREQEDAVRRNAVPAGGNLSYHRSSGGADGARGAATASTSRDTTGAGISEEELFAPLRSGLPPTDAPVRIPTATIRPAVGFSRGGGGGGGGGGGDGGSDGGEGRGGRRSGGDRNSGGRGRGGNGNSGSFGSDGGGGGGGNGGGGGGGGGGGRGNGRGGQQKTGGGGGRGRGGRGGGRRGRH